MRTPFLNNYNNKKFENHEKVRLEPIDVITNCLQIDILHSIRIFLKPETRNQKPDNGYQTPDTGSRTPSFLTSYLLPSPPL